MLMWHPVSERVSDASGQVPYKFKYHVSALAAAPHFTITPFFFLRFCPFGAFFYWFLASSRLSLFFSTFYLISRYFVLSFTFFSVILTVRIFLWNIFEIKDCINLFVISAAEFGLSVMAFIWTVLRILVCCNFWEVHFTAVIMPIFFWTNRI
jgi:hypothetical protein